MASLSRFDHCTASAAGILPQIDFSGYLPLVSRADERRRRADDMGAAEFLTKPVDFDFLKAQLRQLPTGAD
jgi:hypothetical protein